MDVHIGEIDSTIRATDSQALLSPPMLRQIVRAVLAELREQEGREQRRAQERRIEPGAATSTHPWEGTR
jgi:hypothetical protein